MEAILTFIHLHDFDYYLDTVTIGDEILQLPEHTVHIDELNLPPEEEQVVELTDAQVQWLRELE